MNRVASVLIAWTVSAALMVPALAAGAEQQPKAAPPSGTSEPYAPGLGEFMGTIQLRHAKLWFAGTSRNWPLAAYQLDELKEAFDDVTKFQANFQGRPIAKMVDANVKPPIDRLLVAIEAKDFPQFAAAFDALTNGCNACHRGADHDFIVIQRPTAPPFTNQRFLPPDPRRAN